MDNPQAPNDSPYWERKTLEKLIFSTLEEQKTRRRWGIFFKFLGFGYLALVLVALVDWGAEGSHQERHTALIDLTGVPDRHRRGQAAQPQPLRRLQRPEASHLQ